LDSFENVPLPDKFSTDKDFYEPGINIKDDAYNFPVDPKVIAMIEKDKYYGKEEQYPAEHMSCFMSLVTSLVRMR
jgi:hypothetical protein